ncbi:MAG: dihydrodipicolinate synthase family protein [Bacteroidetes bacterium]|nr:dihydrodipicolinate synthase family protein [Bacteroidota bacterium]
MKKIPKIIAPIVTPFSQKGEISISHFSNLLTFLKTKGIDGIWILGSYGAFPLLTEDERKVVAKEFLSLAKKMGFWAIVQIGSPSIEVSLSLALHAEENGADAIATVAPFYYSNSHYNGQNYLLYFDKIVQGSNLPVIFYNNPKTTGFSPSVDFVSKLIETGVVGIKDTVSDIVSIGAKIDLFNKKLPNGYYLGGSSSVLLATQIMGSYGTVCGTAVSMPEIVLRLQESIDKADFKNASKLQKVILQARDIQSRFIGRSVSCYDILRSRGVDAGHCRSPWYGMDNDQIHSVISDLKKIGCFK